MKVLLLLALATFGQCALLGREKCTYGPAYWCSHIHHAKECSAMQHCMTTIWKYQRGDMVGSTENCFDAIKVLDVVRHANDAHLLEQWAVGCTGMAAEKRHICKELMKDDMKEVSQLLKSDLASTQIAAALNLCGGFADHVPRHEQEKQGSSDYCKDCIYFMEDLQILFNNSEGQLEAMFKKLVCSQMGPLESVCGQLVDQYGAMIFNLIFQKLNPQVICHDLHLCANQTRADVVQHLKQMLSKGQRGAEECDVCKSVAKDLQSVLRDTTLQNAIISALKDKVCPLLGSLASECRNYVDTYAPVVFQILAAELDPQTICQTIGLCNGTKSDSGKLIHVPLSSPLGAVRILPLTEKENGIECDVCEKMVAELEKELRDKTADEAKKALEDFCKLLPSSESTKCLQYVDQYATIIINLLLDDVTPKKVCALLSVCPNAKLLNAAKRKMNVKGMEECEVCKMVIGYVRTELNSSDARKFIQQIVDKVCTIVPKGYKQLCELFVNQYAPMLIEKLEQLIDPVQLCTDLGACSTSVSQANSHPLKFLSMMRLRAARPRP
ncbi:hypothetical protein ACOMHN_041833 [Nucella lapillus]